MAEAAAKAVISAKIPQEFMDKVDLFLAQRPTEPDQPKMTRSMMVVTALAQFMTEESTGKELCPKCAEYSAGAGQRAEIAKSAREKAQAAPNPATMSLSPARLRVLAAIRVLEAVGTPTNNEISSVMESMPPNNVAKRTKELEAMGYLKDTGQKVRVEGAGREQTVWALTGKPLPE